MDLLNDIAAHPIDPDYRTTAPSQRSARGWLVAAVLVLAGLLIGTSLGVTLGSAPQSRSEREELLERIGEANGRLSALEQQAGALAAENRAAIDAQTSADPQASAWEDRLAIVAGTSEVTGPGVVVVLDDGPSEAPQARVVDADLRQLVNQLWASGAEAISINGHRVTSRTAIRGAGGAITVNYRSLVRPYRVEAIGESNRLIAEFPDSAAGRWWAYLRQNYGVVVEFTSAGTLRLPADSGLNPTSASGKEQR